MIRRGIGVQGFVSAGGGTDADAQAVITAIESTGVTLTATQKTACNTLVTDLKGYGIWSKMKAVYGFLGGTAGAHKWNWKNPADTDAAFRLVFSGGGTHASTGWTPNGVNGYGDTFLKPNPDLQQNSAHLSFYSRTNLLNSGMNIGVFDSGISPAQGTHFAISYGGTSGQFRARLNSNTASTTYTPTDGRGFFAISRIDANDFKGYRNGVSQFTQASTTGTRSGLKISIGAINANSVVGDFSGHECAFASIGDGLTDTEAANLYTAVQAYQTTLSRQVS